MGIWGHFSHKSPPGTRTRFQKWVNGEVSAIGTCKFEFSTIKTPVLLSPRFRLENILDKQTNERFKIQKIVCMKVANVSMGDEIYIGTKRFP